MKHKYETATSNYSILQAFAIHNRKNPTDAERILWEQLKGGRLGQHFIIEIDGGYHFEGEQPLLDADRAKVLLEHGFKILRFTNEEVIGNIESVIRTITKELKENESYR